MLKEICILKASIIAELTDPPGIPSHTIHPVLHEHLQRPKLFPFAFAILSAWIALPHILPMIDFISSVKAQFQCCLFQKPYAEIILSNVALHSHYSLLQNPFLFISFELLLQEANNFFVFVIISLPLEGKFHEIRIHVSWHFLMSWPWQVQCSAQTQNEGMRYTSLEGKKEWRNDYI